MRCSPDLHQTPPDEGCTKPYGMPVTGCTKRRKLDNTEGLQVSKEGKGADRNLGHLQTLLLDAVRLLTSILEMRQAGWLTAEIAVKATSQALWL